MNYAFVSYLRDIDLVLFHTINGFCGQNLMVDRIASHLESIQLKGVAFMTTFGVLWFQRKKSQAWQRETLVLVLLAVVLSIVMARAIAELFPFRPRPMFTSDIGYRAPLFQLVSSFEKWSSFPSDTAALVFAWTTGFWLLSRWWGLLWACFSIIALVARIYFGVHYPGDVLAGALIGISVTIAINNDFMHTRIAAPIVAVEQRAPAIFYGLLFPLLYEVSTLFGYTRSTGRSILHLLFGFGS
jgi:membrane-associated phospholipid phosphatase